MAGDESNFSLTAGGTNFCTYGRRDRFPRRLLGISWRRQNPLLSMHLSRLTGRSPPEAGGTSVLFKARNGPRVEKTLGDILREGKLTACCRAGGYTTLEGPF